MKAKAIVVGIVVLLMSSFVGISFAQDDDSASDTRPFRDREWSMGIMDAVTEATGLTNQEIMEQLRDGATLTEIIEANGGDVNVIVDELEATVGDWLETRFNTPFELNERSGNRLRNGVVSQIATAVSDATGLEITDIAEQVRDGAILADLISENGGDVDEIVATVVESISNAVNERVESGQITQEQADAVLTNLEATVTDAINGEFDLRRRGNRNGRGFGN